MKTDFKALERFDEYELLKHLPNDMNYKAENAWKKQNGKHLEGFRIKM